MELEDIEMTESFGLKDSSYSCRLSQKSESSPMKMKYKCYECTGNSIKSLKCKACNGMKEVTESNPLVGLLLQVMCTKLGKNVHTIKQLPKLEFDHGKEQRKSSKSQHNYNVYKNNNLQNEKYYETKYRPNFSETTSMNDSSNSNSLDSSFDSMDSSSNMSDFMNRSKERVIKGKNSYHNLQFRHEISEIKEETYASEETYIICDICQKEADIGADYMKCKVCHHYNVCINCYQGKKNLYQGDEHCHSAEHYNVQSHEKPNVQMRRAVTTFTYDKPPSPVKVCSNVDIPISFNQPTVTNVHINPHHPNHNPDSFIHEHPLTRCRYNEEESKEDSKGDSSPTEIYNKNGEEIFSIYGPDKDIKFQEGLKSTSGSSYNIRVEEPKSMGRRESQLGINVGMYQKLFKAYDNERDQESPQKTKKTFMNKSGNFKEEFLNHIETINEERESPSPSQKSMESSPYNQKKDSQTESFPDMNEKRYHQQLESQVKSQECVEKEQNSVEVTEQEQIQENFGCKETKSEKQYESPNKSESEESDFNKNISMTISHNFDNNSSMKEEKNDSDFNEQNKHNQNNYQQSNTKANYYNIKYDTEWSETEKMQESSLIEENKNSRCINEQSIENKNEIMGLEKETESRILESNSKSIKSNKESYEDPCVDSDEEIRNCKDKSYTQRKPNKFTSIRHNNQNDTKNKKGETEKEMDGDEVEISNFSEPIRLFVGEKENDTEKVNEFKIETEENLEDEFPLIVTVTEEKQEDKDIFGGLVKKISEFSEQSTIPHVELSEHEKSFTPSMIPSMQKQSSKTSMLNCDKKICSECLEEVENKTMFMKCQTCENEERFYILCTECSSNNKVIFKHSQNSYIKHSFKPQLYKRIQFSFKSAEKFEDDDDWMKEDYHDTENEHNCDAHENLSGDKIYDTYGRLSPDDKKRKSIQNGQVKEMNSEVEISNYGNTLNPSPLSKNAKLFESAHSIEINSLNRSQNDKSLETEKSSEKEIEKQIISLNSGGAIIDHAHDKEVSIVESYTIMNNSESGSLKDFIWNKTAVTANKNNQLTKTSNLTPLKQVTFKESVEDLEKNANNQLNKGNQYELGTESLNPLNNEHQNSENSQIVGSKLRNRNCSLQIDNPDIESKESQAPSSPSNTSLSNKMICNENKMGINAGEEGEWVIPEKEMLFQNSISIPSRVSLNSIPLTDGTETIQGFIQGIGTNKKKNEKNLGLREERYEDSPDKEDETYRDLVVMNDKGLIRKRSSTEQVGHECGENSLQRKNENTKNSNRMMKQKSIEYNLSDKIDENSGSVQKSNIYEYENILKQPEKEMSGYVANKIEPSRIIVDVGESDNSEMDVQFKENSNKKRMGRSPEKECENEFSGNWILGENEKPRESINEYERENENNLICISGVNNEIGQREKVNGEGNGLINRSLTESQMIEEEDEQEETNEIFEESVKETKHTGSSRRSSQNNEGNRCSPVSSRMQASKGFMFPLKNSSGETNLWKKNQMQNSSLGVKMDFLTKVDQSEKLEKSEDGSDDEDRGRYADVIDKEDEKYGEEEGNSKIHYNYEEEKSEPFVFEEYSCDMCAETPQNKRYHCKKCLDYDLCGKCFVEKCNIEHDHETSDFEEIDKAKQLELDKKDEVEENEKNEEKAFFINKIVQKIIPSVCIKETINRFSTNSLTRSSVTRHSISYKQNSGIDSSSRLSYGGTGNPYQSGFIPRERGSHKF